MHSLVNANTQNNSSFHSVLRAMFDKVTANIGHGQAQLNTLRRQVKMQNTYLLIGGFSLVGIIIGTSYCALHLLVWRFERLIHAQTQQQQDVELDNSQTQQDAELENASLHSLQTSVVVCWCCHKSKQVHLPGDDVEIPMVELQ